MHNDELAIYIKKNTISRTKSVIGRDIDYYSEL